MFGGLEVVLRWDMMLLSESESDGEDDDESEDDLLSFERNFNWFRNVIERSGNNFCNKFVEEEDELFEEFEDSDDEEMEELMK